MHTNCIYNLWEKKHNINGNKVLQSKTKIMKQALVQTYSSILLSLQN